jgi:hypothetical protein
MTMIRLIIAEYKYNWRVLGFSSALFLTGIGINMYQGGEWATHDMRGMKIIMIVMSFISLFFMLMKQIKEKHDRLIMLLPVARLRIGIARGSVVPILWVWWLIIYWSVTAAVRPYPTTYLIWDMLSASGFIMVVNAFPYCARDLCLESQPKWKRLLSGIAYLILLLGFYYLLLIFTANFRFLKLFQIPESATLSVVHYLSTTQGAVMVLLLGLLGSLLSYFLFGQRKNWLT